jgi:hypothetical protein
MRGVQRCRDGLGHRVGIRYRQIRLDRLDLSPNLRHHRPQRAVRSDVERDPGFVALGERHVDDRPVRFTQRRVLAVVREADDLDPVAARIPGSRIAGREALADGILAREEVVGHRFTDDRHERCGFRIGAGDAPAHKWNVECRKEVRPNDVRHRRLSGCRANSGPVTLTTIAPLGEMRPCPENDEEH